MNKIKQIDIFKHTIIEYKQQRNCNIYCINNYCIGIEYPLDFACKIRKAGRGYKKEVFASSSSDRGNIN